MAFVKVELKPTSPILLWFVWKSNPNVPLVGYFLGLLERQNGDRVDKALAIYDDEANRVWIAFLKGSLYSAPWKELLHKKVQITFWQNASKKGFELLYDPEDELEERPHIEFKDKFAGFKFILPAEEQEQKPQKEEPEPIEEEKLPF